MIKVLLKPFYARFQDRGQLLSLSISQLPGRYRAWLPPLAHPCLATDLPARETKREREGEREGEEGASELRAFQSSRVLRI